MIVMSRYANMATTYAPFYIHSFELVQPHLMVEAERLNVEYTDPAKFETTQDKLRWYKNRRGLLQRDVADYVGIDRSTYSSYEEAGRDYYPIEHMERLADFYSISVTTLLDDFNLFLYFGQGKQIKQMREYRGMTQREYAEFLGIPFGTLKQWEIDRVRMSKRAWEKLRQEG